MESISGVILEYFFILIALLGVRRGLKMILSLVAPCCLNMLLSSYRAIWTQFGPNLVFFQDADGQQIRESFLHDRSLHLATLIRIWQIWAPRSQKVRKEEINLRKQQQQQLMQQYQQYYQQQQVYAAPQQQEYDPSQPQSAATAAAAASDWATYYSDGKPYYHNSKTGETKWA